MLESGSPAAVPAGTVGARPHLSPALVERCRDVSARIDGLLVATAPLLTPTEVRSLQAARDVVDGLLSSPSGAG